MCVPCIDKHFGQFHLAQFELSLDFCSPRVVCAMAHSADSGDVYPLDVLMDLPMSHKKHNVRLVIFINFYATVILQTRKDNSTKFN